MVLHFIFKQFISLIYSGCIRVPVGRQKVGVICYSAALSKMAIYVRDWLESRPRLIQLQLELSQCVRILFNLKKKKRLKTKQNIFISHFILWKWSYLWRWGLLQVKSWSTGHSAYKNEGNNLGFNFRNTTYNNNYSECLSAFTQGHWWKNLVIILHTLDSITWNQHHVPKSSTM